MTASDITALIVLFVCLAAIAIISIRDCETDPEYFARESRKRARDLRRTLERMRYR